MNDDYGLMDDMPYKDGKQQPMSEDDVGEIARAITDSVLEEVKGDLPGIVDKIVVQRFGKLFDRYEKAFSVMMNGYRNQMIDACKDYEQERQGIVRETMEMMKNLPAPQVTVEVPPESVKVTLEQKPMRKKVWRSRDGQITDIEEIPMEPPATALLQLPGVTAGASQPSPSEATNT